MNRLKDATSPYLQQHADNPVHWFEWGDAAFEEARRRDVPILISVGYAACHWCHVMAHESFEDDATAKIMNERFVNIKVDREERPDVDAVYMEATTALTGQGGWPMTVFATPAGEPFYTGTYFPREHFQRLLLGVSMAWQNERAEVEQQGSKIVEALIEHTGLPSGPRPTEETLAQAVQNLKKDYDSVNGGFGGAPKFPPSMVLEFLLRLGDEDGIAAHTMESMARGGLYDQLGGGFARYSVDERWVVPHFEKMLYDNAQLLGAYTHWWRATGTPLAKRVALETADFLLADMRTAEGGFASALDADSEGVEGKFYVWTPGQIRAVLGEDDGEWTGGLFGVTEAGTFEHGASVLQLRSDPSDDERYERVRSALREARAKRVPPGRDDKVVAAWNGLAIGSLAEAGVVFEREDLIAAAVGAAELLHDVHFDQGRLVRTSRGGAAGANMGVLDDYASVAAGLLTLYGVTGDARWFETAGSLLDTVLELFPDGAGGFFDTASDAEKLFRRPQDPTDNVTPSGQFGAAGALLSYAALTGSESHRTAALDALGTVTALAARHPRFCGWGLAVAAAALDGPAEVAVVGGADDPRTAALRQTALMSAPPGAVLAVGSPAEPPAVPLMEGRDLVGGEPAAYVCRNFACRMPVTTPTDLRAQLAGR